LSDKALKHYIQKSCYFQRILINSQGFKVHPILNGSPSDSLFPIFYANLSEKWHNGGLMKEAALASGSPEEYDSSGFLARAGWIQAISEYSQQLLRKKVALPSLSREPHLQLIKGLGAEFMAQYKDLNGVHAVLLDELTSWRKH
jgi:hypothetical protein